VYITKKIMFLGRKIRPFLIPTRERLVKKFESFLWEKILESPPFGKRNLNSQKVVVDEKCLPTCFPLKGLM